MGINRDGNRKAVRRTQPGFLEVLLFFTSCFSLCPAQTYQPVAGYKTNRVQFKLSLEIQGCQP